MPFPPQPPQRIAPPCSAGSQVLRHSPTSPHVHVCITVYGLRRPASVLGARRTGDLPVLVQVVFLACAGSNDYAGPDSHSRITQPPCCLPPSRKGVGILIFRVFEAQSPGPPMPLSTLRVPPRDGTRKTRGQDGFATSFPAGDLHPPTTCRFI